MCTIREMAEELQRRERLSHSENGGMVSLQYGEPLVPKRTYIRNTRELESDMGLSDQEIQLLIAAETFREPVEVLDEATDGYFDVVVCNEMIHALSWYHLEGFTREQVTA